MEEESSADTIEFWLAQRVETDHSLYCFVEPSGRAA